MMAVLPVSLIILGSLSGVVSWPSIFATEDAGLEVRLTERGLKFIAENVLFPLESKLTSLFHIPNVTMDVDSFTVDLTNVKLDNVTFHEPQLVVNGSLRALVMTSQVDIHGYVNFTYKQDVFPIHGGGYFSFLAERMTVSLGLNVEPGTYNWWNLTLRESKLDIPALTLECLSSDACVILNRIKSYIVEDAESKIQSGFKEKLPAIIGVMNFILTSYVPLYKLKDDFALNVSLVHAAEEWKSNCFMELGVTGTVLYKGHGALPFAPPTFPETSSCSGNMMTVHISTSTISSGLTALSASPLAATAISLNFYTNNTLLHAFFPDISKVTPVAMVWLNVSLGSAAVHSSPGHLHLSTTVLAQVDLHFENGTIHYNAAKMAVDFDGVFEVWLKRLNEPGSIGQLSVVCVNISELQAVSVKEIDSSIGQIDLPLVKKTLNIVIAEGLPDINKLVSTGAYVLPEDLKLVRMGNYTLTIGQEYIVLGADFTSKMAKSVSWFDFYPSEIVSPLFETIAETSTHLVSVLAKRISEAVQNLSTEPGVQILV